MDRWLIAFFLGAIFSLFLPRVPDFSEFIVLSSIIIVCLLFNRWRILAVFLLAMVWILAHEYSYQNQQKSLIAVTGNKPVIAVGVIDSLIIDDNVKHIAIDSPKAKYKPNTAQQLNTYFNFLITEINHRSLTQAVKVRLSWQQHQQVLAQGQRWQLTIKLKPAHGLANDGGFSYQTWLRQDKLVATGYVKQPSDNKRLAVNKTYRQIWYQNISRYLQNNGQFNNPLAVKLYLALTFGVRHSLSQDDWRILQTTGTQHLLAISGLHIGLVAGGSYWLMLWLLKILPINFLAQRIQNYLLRQNVVLIAAVCSCLCALFYSYLAGFSAPTCRALVMLSIFWLSKLLAIKLNKLQLLLLTVVVVLIWQPMSILAVGFWLSFYAVSIIFLLHWLFKHYVSDASFTSLARVRHYLCALVIIQLGLTVFILPIAALIHYQLPFSALVANLVAVPLLSLLVLPLVLLSLLQLLLFNYELTWLPLVSIALVGLDYLWQWLMLFEHLEVFNRGISWRALLLVMLSLVLVLISVLKTHARLIFLFACVLPTSIVLAYERIYPTATSSWQLHVFDVGQGLAVLIEKSQQAILYDTGASYPSGFNMADAVIIPYLQKQGISQLASVIISHSDNDHAGSLNQLRAAGYVNKLVANDDDLKPNLHCNQQESFSWQALHFKVLYPVNTNSGKANDDSCVLQISDGRYQVLLTGDISKKVEQLLITQAHAKQYALQADVLIAPHHGSKSSSSLAFIEQVAPTYVVFSAGFLNRWQMPTSQVQANYQQLQVNALNTAHSGMVTFQFNNERYHVVRYRQDKFPFWFAN